MPTVLFLCILFFIPQLSIEEETYFDLANPYCTQAVEGTCQICGPTNSSTYLLYNGVCTTASRQDKVFDGQIIKSKL